MTQISPTAAQQIAQAVIAFQRDCTGVTPKSATVLIGADTLVVTLHQALSQAEIKMSQTPQGAARVRDFHRLLFENSAAALHQQLKRILGVDIRGSTVEIDPATSRFIELNPSGDLVQVFRLAQPVAGQTWSTPRDARQPPAQ